MTFSHVACLLEEGQDVPGCVTIFFLKRGMKYILSLLFSLLTTVTYAQSWVRQADLATNNGPVAMDITKDGDVIVSAHGASPGQLLRSIDEGSTWETLFISDLRFVTALESDRTTGRLYAVSSTGGLNFSDDAGFSWSLAKRTYDTSQGFENFRSLHVDRQGIVYTGWSIPRLIHMSYEAGGGLLRSTDHGATFQPISSATTPPFRIWNQEYAPHDIVVAENGNLMASGFGFGEWLSTDDGSTWQSIIPSQTVSGISDFALGPDGTVYAIGQITSQGLKKTSKLLQSRSNELIWVESILPVGELALTTRMAISGEGVILVGTSAGLFRSNDNGATWREFNEGLIDGIDTFQYVRALAFAPDNSAYIAVGSQRSGVPSRVYKSAYPLSDVAGGEAVSEVSVSVSPNPTASTAWISLGVSTAQEVTVDILSITGQRLQRHRVYAQEGSTMLPIDVSSLASGVYLCKIDIGGEVIVRQIVVQ